MAKRSRRLGKTPGERGESRPMDELLERGFEGCSAILHKPLKRAIKYCDKLGISPKQTWRVLDRVIQDSW